MQFLTLIYKSVTIPQCVSIIRAFFASQKNPKCIGKKSLNKRNSDFISVRNVAKNTYFYNFFVQIKTGLVRKNTACYM